MTDYRDQQIEDQGTSDEGAPAREFETFVKTIYERLQVSELRLQLPAGTLAHLHAEPDNSFVIKIIAAVEVIVNELIVHAMTRPTGGLGGNTGKEVFGSAADFITERLQLDGRAGKLEYGRRLNVLTAKDIKYIQAVARIRNRYAHNIRNAGRSLIELTDEEHANNKNIFSDLTYGMVSSKSDLANGLLKIFVTWAFSTFLHSAERRMIVAKGGLFGLLGLNFEELEKRSKME